MSPNRITLVERILKTPGEHTLLRRYLRSKIRKKYLEMEELGRYGRTDARLLLGYFRKNQAGLPFVFKIDTKGKIKKEHAAIVKVRDKFKDALSGFDPLYSDTLGVLAYRNFSGLNKWQIRDQKDTLDKLVYSAKFPKVKLRTYFKAIYNALQVTAHKAGRLKEMNIHWEYRKYLRKPKSTLRIKSLLGNEATRTKFVFLGTTIVNPVFAEKSLHENPRVIESKKATIHGDLHLNNVIFDANDRPHFIDFAWAGNNRHVLKDYVLMENSLRFLLFPREENLSEQKEVDKCLLKEKGYSELRAFRFSTSRKKDLYARLATMLRVVRTSARSCIGRDYTFRDYLTAQFLVLYGLFKYESYNTHIALRALGLIARELEKS